LATALLIGGLVLLLTGGAPISYPDPFYMAFGGARLLGIPAPVFLFAIAAALTAWLLGATAFGRRVYAIGGNERAARFSGLPIGRVRTLCFVLAGAAAGIAGVLFLSRTGYVSYASAPDLLLQTIAGVVVGGIALEGGRGRVRQAVGGVLFLACLNT
jgi:ribose/xylose/arabinose/galactoside ABC-type transport system permease subunit